MRNIITVIIVWAILLGVIATGVKVMATPPAVDNGTVIVSDDSNITEAQRININRDDIKYEPR